MDGSSSTPITPIPRRKTRLEVGLSETTAEEAELFKAEPLRYRPSTLKKHTWVKRIFDVFTTDKGKEPFPFDKEVLSVFIRTCGYKARYTLASIENIIIPSLKRMHLEKLGLAVPSEINSHLSLLLKELKANPNTVKEGPGKEPMLLADMARIIDSIPDTYVHKTENASLFLFSLLTGSRGCTCEAITLGDIQRCVTKDGGETLVTIRTRVLKRDPRSDHSVTVEGDMVTRSPLNVVYWLCRHVEEFHGLSLLKYSEWGAEVKRRSLWGCDKEAMRSRLQWCAWSGGYPLQCFGFHSLRSGYISNELIASYMDGLEPAAVLEKTAIIAGWVPNSPAQLRYVKANLRRTMVANQKTKSVPTEEKSPKKEIDCTEEKTQKNTVMDKFLLTPEQFHNFEILSPRWRDNAYWDAFRVELTKLTCGGIEEEKKKAHLNRCLCKGSVIFCDMKPALRYVVNDDVSTRAIARQARHHGPCIVAASRKVARTAIILEIRMDPSRVAEIAANFSKLIPSMITTNADEMKTTVPSRSTSHTPTQPKPIQKRRAWDDSEEKIVIDGLKDKKKWTEIQQMLPHRTASDIARHFSIMVRNSPALKSLLPTKGAARIAASSDESFILQPLRKVKRKSVKTARREEEETVDDQSDDNSDDNSNDLSFDNSVDQSDDNSDDNSIDQSDDNRDCPCSTVTQTRYGRMSFGHGSKRVITID